MKIVCKICSKEYENYIGLSSHISQNHNISSKEYYDKYFKKINEGLCECGKNTNFIKLSKGYLKFCSVKCAQNSIETKEKKKQTSIKNFGVENPNKSEEIKKKKKQTNIKKYNVENPSQLKKIKEKKKQTSIKNFGVENPNQNKKIKDKIKCTNLEKYGVECSLQNKDIKEKRKFTFLEKYGVECSLQNKYIRNKIKQTNLNKFIPKVIKLLENNNLKLLSEYDNVRDILKLKCLKCNIIFETQYFYIQQGYGKCPKCFPKLNGYSKLEKELLEFIKSIL